MTDISETQTDDKNEPQMELLPPPIITAPTASVVSRPFTIRAIVPSVAHTNWDIDFYKVGEASRFKRYSGGLGAGLIELVAPADLPEGENIYFKIQYRSHTGIYSLWATSRTFKID
ncbi:hypothetical protein J2Y86_004463 [Pseudomonas migulae]|nr:hypothetical protein [Pseudomonas migulae]